MSRFSANRVRAMASGSPPALCSKAPVVFGSREIALDVGFLAARIRLLNVLHSGRMTEASALADLLALLPWPADDRPQAGPRLVWVRLQEPTGETGIVIFPMTWAAAGSDGRLQPVLDLGLTLRAGRPGQAGRAFLRLTGTLWLPVAPASWQTLDARPARQVVAASIEPWLSRLAHTLTRPSAGLSRRPQRAAATGSARSCLPYARP